MRYVVTGGGTGGHVTPIKYVLSSLKQLDDDCVTAYVGQSGDRFAELISKDDVDQKELVKAGKFRRYNRPLWETIIDLPTHLLNIRDAFFVGIGYVQSLLFLRRFRADALFVKGGYVSVPVGLAAATLGIPIITHDSDMTPGLANKVIGKWATYNTVASKLGSYPYPDDKKVVVGVPINEKFFEEADDNRQAKAKKAIGAEDNKTVVFVIGGGLGARSINNVMTAIAKHLIDAGHEVFHVTGKNNLAEVKGGLSGSDISNGYHALEFISDQDLMFEHYVAADVVVSRAGATSVAEIAGLAKPAVIIPGSQLADQQANAKELDLAKAAVILQDNEISVEPSKLFEAIDIITKDSELRNELSHHIQDWANKEASSAIAELLVRVGRG